MRHGQRIAVIIPAYNESGSIQPVIRDIPDWVDRIIVADNNSTDDTAARAADAGAEVVTESTRGYGAACLAGIDALRDEEIVVFLDGDYSDYPEDMAHIVDPIALECADMVIGSRAKGEVATGAMTPQQRWGNWLACTLMRIIWGLRHSDLGPFRALPYATLVSLGMQDRTWGWTVEMQIRAAKCGMRVVEAPVRYRKRIGHSKISGTVSGVVRAGTKILYTIAREAILSKAPVAPRQKLVLFTKYPTPGKSKTRLIPELGAEGAAALHRKMAIHACSLVRRIESHNGTAGEIRYTGSDESSFRDWLGADLTFKNQNDGDLGVRMFAAVDDGLSKHDSVILIGTDCPALNDATVNHAFALLRKHDVVIGPAEDGGYYLIGMRKAHRELFEGIEWGSAEVLAKTRGRIDALGLRAAYLQRLPDIDRPEDLKHWNDSDDEAPAISVVIPTLNEEPFIADAIASVSIDSSVEVIVADGGSTDRTCAIAAEYGARVIERERGRGAQMNAGANAARGQYLMFLHADTVAPSGFAAVITDVCDTPGVAAGAFKLCVDGGNGLLRAVIHSANLRARALQLPYGDQAFFCKRGTFERIGPFVEAPIMEDYEWIRRARRHGEIRIVPMYVQSSARRWKESGTIRLTMVHQLIVIGYTLRIPPRLLARLRRRPS